MNETSFDISTLGHTYGGQNSNFLQQNMRVDGWELKESIWKRSTFGDYMKYSHSLERFLDIMSELNIGGDNEETVIVNSVRDIKNPINLPDALISETPTETVETTKASDEAVHEESEASSLYYSNSDSDSFCDEYEKYNIILPVEPVLEYDGELVYANDIKRVHDQNSSLRETRLRMWVGLSTQHTFDLHQWRRSVASFDNSMVGNDIENENPPPLQNEPLLQPELKPILSTADHLQHLFTFLTNPSVDELAQERQVQDEVCDVMKDTEETVQIESSYNIEHEEESSTTLPQNSSSSSSKPRKHFKTLQTLVQLCAEGTSNHARGALTSSIISALRQLHAGRLYFIIWTGITVTEFKSFFQAHNQLVNLPESDLKEALLFLKVGIKCNFDNSFLGAGSEVRVANLGPYSITLRNCGSNLSVAQLLVFGAQISFVSINWQQIRIDPHFVHYLNNSYIGRMKLKFQSPEHHQNICYRKAAIISATKTAKILKTPKTLIQEAILKSPTHRATRSRSKITSRSKDQNSSSFVTPKSQSMAYMLESNDLYQNPTSLHFSSAHLVHKDSTTFNRFEIVWDTLQTIIHDRYACNGELLLVLQVGTSFVSELAHNHYRYHDGSDAPTLESLDWFKDFNLEEVLRGYVRFCTNLDVTDDWNLHTCALRDSLPTWLMCSGSSDFLGRVRQKIPGMTLPQLYVKVPGVWTGLHEENDCFRSLNCNCGPDPSEWYSVEAEHVPRMREMALTQFGVDIYRKEGMFFPSEEWLREMKIPFQHGLQKAGDMMLLKGQTVHWVRALGFSVNFSWNFGILDLEQLNVAIHRYEVNDSLNIHNVVALKTLVLDTARELMASLKTQLVYSSARVKKCSGSVLHLPVSCVQSLRKRAGAGLLDSIDKNDDQQKEAILYRLCAFLLLSVRTMIHQLAEVVIFGNLQWETELPGGSVIHCEIPSCRREIFEAFLDCRKCGFVCLSCALKGCMVTNTSAAVTGQNAGENQLTHAPHPTSTKLVCKTDPDVLIEQTSAFVDQCRTYLGRNRTVTNLSEPSLQSLASELLSLSFHGACEKVKATIGKRRPESDHILVKKSKSK